MKIESTALQELYAYWDGKRAKRAMPSRSDIDPLEIPLLLPNLLICDVEPESERFKVRLVGTKIVEFYGADYTGQYLDDLDLGDRRHAVLKAYRDCIRSKQPSVKSHMFWNIRGLHFQVERIILPLSDDQVRVNKILAGISFKSQ